MLSGPGSFLSGDKRKYKLRDVGNLRWIRILKLLSVFSSMTIIMKGDFVGKCVSICIINSMSS